MLITSPSATILEGITRDSIMILARDMGYEVKEQPISRDQLYRSDEVFATGTAAEVVAIAEIDHRKIGEGRMGPITRKLQQAFQPTVQGKHARSAGWLTPVAAPAAVGSRLGFYLLKDEDRPKQPVLVALWREATLVIGRNSVHI